VRLDNDLLDLFRRRLVSVFDKLKETHPAEF